MTPIPKTMLPHSAELTTCFGGGDKWGDAQTRTSVTLGNVYIEPSFSTVADASAVETRLSAKLFFDTANSLPKDVQFAVQGDTVNGRTVSRQEIAFGGRTYLVKSVSAYYDSNRLHHFEVGLV